MSDLGPETAGAAIGAGIATVYGWKHGGVLTSLLRFVAGSWFGAVGTEPALRYLDWEPTISNTLFVASVIGLGAFILVQAVLAEGTRKMAQKGAQAVIGKVTGVKEEVKSEP